MVNNGKEVAEFGNLKEKAGPGQVVPINFGQGLGSLIRFRIVLPLSVSLVL